MPKSFFSGWEQIAATALATVVVYVFALVAVRVAGRRTVAELSAFDVVITVALGSVVASTALPADPSVADGMSVLGTLLVLQVVLGAARQRFPKITRYVDFRPYVVVRDGSVIVQRNPLTAQLTQADIMSKLRRRGVFELDDVHVVILESDGHISVVPQDVDVSATALQDVLSQSPYRRRE